MLAVIEYMKILAFAGSNSVQSINRKLVIHTLTYFQNIEINLLDLNDYEMPLFSVDRQLKDGFPQKAYNFLAQIESCDCLLYTSDAADERSSVDLGGRRIINKKTTKKTE